ncbi:hypothetical protein WA026_012565 [Henosepilachna vigintioctopunctata]|uniref:Uncharacterized protein n=1 Tax=Henosepilachna vigintioctopunctata TaxID=420089 RepID=A0AAW1TXF3_9CUCU
MSDENKIKIIKPIIIPGLLYGGEIWEMDNARIERLQDTLNRRVRRAVEAPRYLPNQNLHEELKIKKLTDMIKERRKKMLENMEANTNNRIRRTTEIIYIVYNRCRGHKQSYKKNAKNIRW